MIQRQPTRTLNQLDNRPTLLAAFWAGQIRQPILLMVIFITTGFFLRIIHIEAQPLWGDEGLTLLIGQEPIVRLFLGPIDPTPGLYYALHKLFIGPDASLLAARSISLIAGTASIATIYAVARLSRVPALLAALLLALSFPLIDYSQEARAYGLQILLTLLSGGAFIWWDRSRRLGALLSFMALATLSFYTHFVSIFWIFPILVACIYVAWRDPLARRHVGLTLTLMALLAIPEANRLLHYHQPSFSWLTQATPTEAINTLSYVQLPFGLFENDYWRFGPELTAIASLLCYGLLALLTVRHRGKLKQWALQNQAGAAVILIWLSVPVAVWLFGYAVKPIFLPRTILIGAPGFILAVSLLLKFEHRLAASCVVGLFAANLALIGTVRPKEDWRSVARSLESNVRGGDVIILCPSWKVMAFRHAIRTEVDAPLVLQRDNGMMLIESRLGSRRDWAKGYFEALRKPDGVAGAQIALGNANRIWRIDSDCPR